MNGTTGISDDRRDLIDVMVSIIRSKTISDKTAKTAALVISADAHFNARVGILKERKEGGDRIFDLIDFAEEVLIDCRKLGDDLRDGLDEGSVYDCLCDLRRRLKEISV